MFYFINHITPLVLVGGLISSGFLKRRAVVLVKNYSILKGENMGCCSKLVYLSMNGQTSWKQVDNDGKGTLDYGEFLAVSLHLRRLANEEHLHKAFSYFDKDGNGYIEPDELRDALMEDGADDCTDVANDIFQEVDTDKVKIQRFPLFCPSRFQI
jgi:hypothetical protein